MSPMKPIRLLLGPQRPSVNLGTAIRDAGIPDGKIAVISAGWQEAEGDIDDVRALVDRELHDLGLWTRTETLLAVDKSLHEAYRKRQESLKELQRLYRLRLRHLVVAARRTLRAESDPVLLLPEQRHAFAQLRALDRHHLHRVRRILHEFSERFDSSSYGAIAEQRAQIAEIIDDSQAVLITGGNVVVTLNRMLLFGLEPLLQEKHIVAWSAGAMVLSENIVLFHDRLPQGRRDAEILGPGICELPGYVILPDAKHRIRENDRARSGAFCRRFSPDTCITLDSGSMLRFEGSTLVQAESVRRITSRGGFAAVTPS